MHIIKLTRKDILRLAIEKMIIDGEQRRKELLAEYDSLNRQIQAVNDETIKVAEGRAAASLRSVINQLNQALKRAGMKASVRSYVAKVASDPARLQVQLALSHVPILTKVRVPKMSEKAKRLHELAKQKYAEAEKVSKVYRHAVDREKLLYDKIVAATDTKAAKLLDQLTVRLNRIIFDDSELHKEEKPNAGGGASTR